MTTKKKNGSLTELIKTRKGVICVIGLGYVGLPLVTEFAKAGFFIWGIDDNPDKVDLVNKGVNYILKQEEELLKDLVKKGKIKATTDYSVIGGSDIIIICVPTPLTKNQLPDISYVEAVSVEAGKNLRPGQLIVLESTTYPGTTEEVLKPLFDRTGLKAGKDYFLAFSPERVDPGNKDFFTGNTAKIIGGITPKCSAYTKLLYEQIIEGVYAASSPPEAEMTKLLENLFRCVNIALVNELAMLSKRMGINIWEVIDLASTKPYGFMPFYPGPGLGGHCIPIDPFYLTWKAREYDFHTKFIELAGEINLAMPYHVVHILQDALSGRNISLNNSKILVLGVAYKKDIDDPRESPALKIFELLEKKGAKVSYNDDHIRKIKINGKMRNSVKLKDIEKYDCVVITADHSYYNFKDIVDRSKLVIDTRNGTKGIKSDKIVIL
jgi:UDP-N-acetyl-D-glucosamine dehydrogenase